MTEKMMNKVMLECIRIARQNMDDDQYPIGAIITDDRGKVNFFFTKFIKKRIRSDKSSGDSSNTKGIENFKKT